VRYVGLPQALVRKHTPGSRTGAQAWSKPVNVETWGHVSGPIVMAHALAELRCGIVARQHENGFKSGRNLGHTL
jgi:hypothetical protein